MATPKTPSRSVAFLGTVTIAASTDQESGVKLNSFTLAGVKPTMLFSAHPHQALDAGLAVGVPYCVTAGTLVVPVVNATSSTVTPAADLVFTIVGH